MPSRSSSSSRTAKIIASIATCGGLTSISRTSLIQLGQNRLVIANDHNISAGITVAAGLRSLSA